MKVIVDSNILFSACIAPFGDNADLLLNPKYLFERYTCHYLIVEMLNTKIKLLGSPNKALTML